MRRIQPRASLATAFCLLLILIAAPASHAADGCTKYASPSGSDTAAGTEAAPFATANQLADSLAPGETGCLRAGTYSENLKIAQGGAPGAPLTIRSYPGERATVVGRMWVARGADFVTISDLDINGRNATDLPSPTVNASDTVFDHVDVTNDHTAICFNLGSSSWGRAVRTIIENSRIHDCGVLPSDNRNHGIYISAGTDVVIRGNVIYDNVDRGVQLYPDAQHTTITGNVIDGNGEGVIFSGEDGVASNGNVVTNNVIANSNIRSNVESYYPVGTPAGVGNVVTGNCVYASSSSYGGGSGGGISTDSGFVASANVVASPVYADRAAHDFRVQAGSTCGAALAGLLDPSVAAGKPVADTAAAPAVTSASSTAATTASTPTTASSTPTKTTTPRKTTASGNSHYKLRARAAAVRRVSCQRARAAKKHKPTKKHKATKRSSKRRSSRTASCR